MITRAHQGSPATKERATQLTKNATSLQKAMMRTSANISNSNHPSLSRVWHFNNKTPHGRPPFSGGFQLCIPLGPQLREQGLRETALYTQAPLPMQLDFDVRRWKNGASCFHTPQFNGVLVSHLSWSERKVSDCSFTLSSRGTNVASRITLALLSHRSRSMVKPVYSPPSKGVATSAPPKASSAVCLG